MSEWLEIGHGCNYCGKPLEARPGVARGGFVISGYEPMDYRHAHNGEVHCYTQHTARPYSDAGKYADYERVRKAIAEHS